LHFRILKQLNGGFAMTSNNPTPGDGKQGDTPMEVPGDNHEQGHTITDNPGNRQQQQGSGEKQRQQGGQKNEGEGNKTAARHYNEATQQSAQNPGKTRQDADEAKRAIDSPEGEDLERAEEIGRKPARN
jgi:hypothetical protein